MIDDLFDYLDRIGVGKALALGDGSIVKQLTRRSEGKLHDICAELSGLLPFHADRAEGPFEFIASASLGGGAVPCAIPECRLNRVDSLSVFAAMYADRVLIPDVFWDLGFSDTISKPRLIAHLTILHKLRPLLEAGLVGFANPNNYALCSECYERVIGVTPNEFNDKLRSAAAYLGGRYSNEATFTSGRKASGVAFVEMKGPDDLVEHGAQYVYLNKVEKSLEKLFSKEKNLTINQVDRLKVTRMFIRDVIGNIQRQNFYSNVFGTSYLTDRKLEFDQV
jgi:hypothetical protein